MFDPLRRMSWWLCVLLLTATRLDAGQVTLAWDPVTDADVAGYVVVYGTQPGVHPVRLDAGSQTEYTVTGLADGTYYFAVEAYTFGGLTSGPSNEVTATLAASVLVTPPPSGSSCATPDPFASMGGGTCCGGGWLPPGLACKAPASSTTPTAPTTTTPPATTTPVVSPSVCSTPDPFAALGGGICCNGGWIMRGMACSAPSATTGPTTSPTTPPTSTYVPTVPTTSTCSTADPFAALGGGVCCNGGWIMKGMACSVPSSSPAAPATTAPSTTSSPTGCTTPDPFATLPNLIGVCVNGGWVPRPR
jgi:hypothetical protein